MPSSAEQAWALVWRIFLEDKPRRIAVMGDLGLSFMQYMALARLEPGVPLPMSALASAMQCDNSNVTGIVDRLEAAGLAERRPAEHDRRVKAILLTDKGEALRAEAMTRMGRPPPAIDALSEKDARALRDLLAKAAASLDR